MISDGPTSEIGTSRPMDFSYLWLTHRTPNDIEVVNRSQSPEINLTFLIVDKINIQSNYLNINGANSDNNQEIISDSYQILQDLITFIITDLSMLGISIVDKVSWETIFDDTDDKVSGAIADNKLRLKHWNCVTPLGDVELLVASESVTSLRYLTCQTLTACTSFQAYVANAISEIPASTDYYVTGGTYSTLTEEIILTRNDGGSVIISGFE